MRFCPAWNPIKLRFVIERHMLHTPDRGVSERQELVHKIYI